MSTLVQISHLEDYISPENNEWFVEAFVSFCSQKKKFGNKNGQYVRFGLVDSNNVKLSGVIWNEACDIFYESIQEAFRENCLLRITSPKVKYTNKKFQLKGYCDYEISLND